MYNKDTFETQDVVQEYINDALLHPAEKKIISILSGSLSDLDMLDLGVGGGRTAIHFEPLVKKYIGTDYSENMIESCKQKFPGLDLRVLDARLMPEFDDNTFDFILFSFNGIDYMDKDERTKTFKEIKRVCKQNGFFVFSSHNINAVPRIFSLSLSLSPWILARRILRFIKIHVYNWPLSRHQGKETIIIDSAHNFRLKSFYIDPKEQISQLKNLGFHNVKAYDQQGNENLETTDTWVYYMCQLI